MIRTAAVSGESLCFPFARQVARLIRQTQGRKDEEVALVTSLPPDQLEASRWLQINRDGWGIENGLHQRLDVSLNDDRCRVQRDKGLLLLGAYRRLAVSLFMQWRGHQLNPRHLTTTDFQTVMAENHRQRALQLVLAKRSSLKNTS